MRNGINADRRSALQDFAVFGVSRGDPHATNLHVLQAEGHPFRPASGENERWRRQADKALRRLD
jgi:hypothetical protein